MAEKRVKRIVAVDVIHRAPKKGELEKIRPGTILKGIPEKEIQEYLARGAARVEEVIVDVAESKKPAGNTGSSDDDKNPGDGGNGGEESK